MQPFVWSKECSVGIPALDAQHRHLIELLSELARATRSGESDKLAPAALQKMNRYAERHLSREELILRIRVFPGYAEHKAEHDVYRRKVAALQLFSERRDLGIRISNFLTDWWRSHILGSDHLYARFFRSRRTAA